jgi:NAD(P)-dependent dehydrogenase (short-subunit alcohol dehydrogenase family)
MSGTGRTSIYYGWPILVIAALAMVGVGTLPGRTQGLGPVTKSLLRDLGMDRITHATINLWDGPYIASKAGVKGLVHVLANEMRGRNNTVNAVAPGPVGTELFLNGKSEEQIRELAKLAPLERPGEPEDIARVVSFLAGPEGGWINSQVLRVEGGFAYRGSSGAQQGATQLKQVILVTGRFKRFRHSRSARTR